MKTILTILSILISVYCFANPPLWIAPNTKTITVSGGGDTAITINRVLLVEFVTYNGQDSTAQVSFNQFRNAKQWKAANPIATDVPVTVPAIKIPQGQAVTLNYILQQARAYYLSLGYSANIQ